MPDNWWLLCCGMAGPLFMLVMLLFFQGVQRDDDDAGHCGSRASQDATD